MHVKNKSVKTRVVLRIVPATGSRLPGAQSRNYSPWLGSTIWSFYYYSWTFAVIANRRL
jgi:hypothetical protein